MHDSILDAVLIPAVEEEYFEKAKNLIKLSDASKSEMSLEISRYFINKGFETLQIMTEDPSIIRKIKKYHSDVIIIAGGHINSIGKAVNFLDNQSDYIIVERLFARRPSLVESYLKLFGKRLIVSIGDKNGFLVYNENIRTEEFAGMLGETGVKNVLYVSDETKLTGSINLETFKKVRNIMRFSNIGYSGGISSFYHLKMLKSLGVNFVVVGTALYTGSFNYRSAIKLFKDEN